MRFHDALRLAIEENVKIRITTWSPEVHIRWDKKNKVFTNNDGGIFTQYVNYCVETEWEVVAIGPAGVAVKIDDEKWVYYVD